MKAQTKQSPQVFLLADGQREVPVYAESAQLAIYAIRLAFPSGDWQTKETLDKPRPGMSLIDATKLNGDSVEQAHRMAKDSPQPKPAPTPKVEPKAAKAEPKAGVKPTPAPKPAPAKPAKVVAIPLAEFGFDEVMARPRKLKLPTGAEWPEMTGDKIIWQMASTGRYTTTEVVATVIANESKEYAQKTQGKTMAEWSIPVVLGWMRAAGVKGAVK